MLIEETNQSTVQSFSRLRIALESAIKAGRLDLVKKIIEAPCINADPPLSIASIDWGLVWLAIYTGQFDILKYFVEEAPDYGQPRVDVKYLVLRGATQRAHPDIKQYLDLLVNLTGEEIDDVLKKVRSQYKPRRY